MKRLGLRVAMRLQRLVKAGLRAQHMRMHSGKPPRVHWTDANRWDRG